MRKLPVRYIWIGILLHTLAHGQSPDAPRDYVIGNKNIFRRMISVETVNDFVYFLGLGSNDEGYTLGNFFKGRIPQAAKNRYFDISISSKLYTEAVGIKYRDARGLTIKPQYFTEISFLNLSYSKYVPQKKIFFCTQIGAGIYNEKEPIPVLALFMQGGMDGKTGFHELLGPEQERQNNVSTGGIRLNFYTQFSVKKFYFFNKKGHEDAAYFSIAPGGRLVFPFIEGSQLFFNMRAMVPIVRVKAKHKIKFRMAALYAGELSFHTNGLLFVPEIGLEFDLFFFKIGYSNMLLLGQQQDNYINYSDPDPLMRLYTRITF